jgi:trimeric autotransporter adhesin
MLNLRSFVLALAACASLTPAQTCGPQWVAPSNGGERLEAELLAVTASTMWDSDGTGPSSPQLIVGGRFTSVGSTAANGVAGTFPSSFSWFSLGSGITGDVNALASVPGTSTTLGQVYAGGTFSQAGSTAVNNIAQWNGFLWEAMSTGITGSPVAGSGPRVEGMTILPNGNLVVVGSFTNAGSVTANCIAIWNRSSQFWQSVGSGASNGVISGSISAVASTTAGDIVAGGSFNGIGLVSASNIARWNGTTWVPLGSGVNGQVRTITRLANGDLLVGGSFSQAGSITVNNIARWNGTTWSALGTGITGPNFSVPGVVWASLQLSNGDILVAGDFTTAGGVTARRIARWNGIAWSSVNSNELDFTGNAVLTLTNTSTSTVFAGGRFSRVNLSSSDNLGNAASLDATTNTWSAVSGLPNTGFNNTGPIVFRIARSSVTGDHALYGNFSRARSAFGGFLGMTGSLAWDGRRFFFASSSSGLPGNGTLFPDPRIAPRTLAYTQLPSGVGLIGGAWNNFQGVQSGGLGFSSFAQLYQQGFASNTSPLTPATVYALVTMPNGDLIAAGDMRRSWNNFLTPPDLGNIARWNGTAWVPLGTGTNGLVRTLLVAANGDLIAAGDFTNAGGVAVNRIARWNGNAWSALPGATFNGSVLSLAQLSTGEFVVGGSFTTPFTNLARTFGSGWSGLGQPNGRVNALLVRPDGTLVAGGNFTTIAGQPANRIASWNGTSWAPLAAGIAVAPAGSTPQVYALAHDPRSGELLVGGNFQTYGTFTNQGSFARWSSTGAPWIAVQPVATVTIPQGQNFSLTASASTGYASVTAQWQRNAIAITNGAGGASAGGGTVAGASFTLTNPSSGTTETLTITNAQPSDSGTYTVTYANACGSAVSVPVLVTVTPTIIPCDDIDFNNNGVFPEDQDVIDFFDVLAGGTPATCDAIVGCNDIDFNNNGVFPEDQDVVDFFNVLAGGLCPA